MQLWASYDTNVSTTYHWVRHMIPWTYSDPCLVVATSYNSYQIYIITPTHVWLQLSLRHMIATKPSMAQLHALLCLQAPGLGGRATYTRCCCAHMHVLLCVVACLQALTKRQGAAKQDFCANILGAKQHFFWVSTDQGAAPAEGR